MSEQKLKIRQIVARVAMVPLREVTETSVINEMGVNSIEMIECVLALETAFRVELAPETLQKAHTMGDLCQAVDDALKAEAR